MIVAVAAGEITRFVLLMLKADRRLDASYAVVAIPAFVSYGVALVVLLPSAGFYALTKDLRRFLGALALVVLAAGSLWTQAELVAKFDRSLGVSYSEALLPVTVAFGVSAALVVAAVLLPDRLARPVATNGRSVSSRRPRLKR